MSAAPLALGMRSDGDPTQPFRAGAASLAGGPPGLDGVWSPRGNRSILNRQFSFKECVRTQVSPLRCALAKNIS